MVYYNFIHFEMLKQLIESLSLFMKIYIIDILAFNIGFVVFILVFDEDIEFIYDNTHYTLKDINDWHR